MFNRSQEEAAVVVVVVAIPGSCGPMGLQKPSCRGRHSLLTPTAEKFIFAVVMLHVKDI